MALPSQPRMSDTLSHSEGDFPLIRTSCSARQTDVRDYATNRGATDPRHPCTGFFDFERLDIKCLVTRNA